MVTKKNYIKSLTALVLSALLVLTTGCGNNADDHIIASAERVHDNDGVYNFPSDEYSNLYVDVSSENSAIPFSQVLGSNLINGTKPSYNISVYDGEGTLGNEKLPALGDIQIKGGGNYTNYYRSFKISLNDEDRYKGQRVLLLYKCPQDATKITMKLGMDLFSLFDDVVSTRTEFVRLYIKDDSTQNKEYNDYGLYILAENPGSKYLRTHGLDRNGELYEIKDFDFSYDSYINASEIQKREMLEYKNGDNPQKFEEMLKDINDTENFDYNFNKYFNKDNYLTWIGGNCLIGNFKASTSDFLIYSPTDSDKWYFFPMPTQDIFLEEIDRRWSTPPDDFAGIGWFTDNVIHFQFLRDENNRKMLSAKTDELLDILEPKIINEMLVGYKNVLVDFLSQGPDKNFQKLSIEEMDSRINRTYDHILNNYSLFKNNLNNPLPFNLYPPSYSSGVYTIRWQEAISNSDVTYHIKIATDLAGTEVLVDTSTDQTQIQIEEELEGNLYVFLTAENSSGVQPANCYEKGAENSIWGVKVYTFSGKEEAV